MLSDNGTPRPTVSLIDIPWLRLAHDPKANLELALTWASFHGRTAVVDYLMRRGVHAGARNQWGIPAT